MAQLTMNRAVPQTLQQRLDLADGIIVDMQMTPSTTIYQGAFVGFVPGAGGTTGTIHPLVASDSFAGIALAKVVSASTGVYTCPVYICGYFTHAITSLAITDVGKVVFADVLNTSSDNVLALTSTATYPAVGRVANFVSTGIGIVHMKTPGSRAGASAQATLSYIALVG